MCSGESGYDDLPFFPNYETELLPDESLRINWFETNFCQSRYNLKDSQSGSNACTLIAVILATKCHEEKYQLFGPEKPINFHFIYGFAQSMLEGNKIHKQLKTKGILSNINLTVPEAIEFASKNNLQAPKEWKSMLYMEPLQETLFENIKDNWMEWLKTLGSKNNKDLYIILISDARSVLFIIHNEHDTISLVDSHQHSSTRGAFIAVVKRQRLKLLCQWFGELMNQFYHSKPELYELSFLYFDDIRKNEK